MSNIIKKHKIVIITLLIEILLFWFVFYSGIVIPFINPSIEEYENHIKGGTSFPRDYTQMLLWYLIHMPSSLIIDSVFSSGYEVLLSLSVIQNCFIAYLIEKHIRNKCNSKR